MFPMFPSYYVIYLNTDYFRRQTQTFISVKIE